MTAEEYAKKYDGFYTFKKIALEAFEAGTLVNPNFKVFNQMKDEIKRLKAENKEMHDLLDDADRLGEYIGGM